LAASSHALPAPGVISVDSDQAACRHADPELFFPVGAGEYAKKTAARALVFCRACPITDECLQYALERDHRFGIWGGTTAGYRRAHYQQKDPR